VNDAVFPADFRGRIFLRVSPVEWAPRSVVYGVPFGEMPFGSSVPGSGPTLPGDERPVDLWQSLKEFDGWFRWDASAGRVTMATEARGAHFAGTGVSFLLAPQSRVLSEQVTQHVSMHSTFDVVGGARSERQMWELLEQPVVAVSEDRFGPASLAGSFSLLDWSDPDVIVTALRRAGDGGVVLRSYAHSDHTVQARLRPYLPPVSLTVLTPVEEAIGRAEADRKYGPWEIQTLRVAFPPAAGARK